MFMSSYKYNYGQYEKNKLLIEQDVCMVGFDAKNLEYKCVGIVYVNTLLVRHALYQNT